MYTTPFPPNVTTTPTATLNFSIKFKHAASMSSTVLLGNPLNCSISTSFRNRKSVFESNSWLKSFFAGEKLNSVVTMRINDLINDLTYKTVCICSIDIKWEMYNKAGKYQIEVNNKIAYYFSNYNQS